MVTLALERTRFWLVTKCGIVSCIIFAAQATSAADLKDVCPLVAASAECSLVVVYAPDLKGTPEICPCKDVTPTVEDFSTGEFSKEKIVNNAIVSRDKKADALSDMDLTAVRQCKIVYINGQPVIKCD